MDNRFRSIINIGRGVTENSIAFSAYLHNFKMAAVGHLKFLTFDILAVDFNVIPRFLTNLNTLILLEWFILRLKALRRSKTRWLPIITLKIIYFLQLPP